MPVKVRCRGCQKVLNAPDKARGKVIQCPECGTKLKVPGEGGGAAPAAKARKPAPKQPAAGDSSEFLAGLNVDQLESEHGEEKVCPYCAAELDPEDPVCRKCGMNTVTGQMDVKEAKKRARKGADPALFYSKAWSDSWEFLAQYWRLGLRTGLIWTVFLTVMMTCAFLAKAWVFDEPAEAPAAPIPGEEVEAPGNPWLSPGFFFYAGLGTVFFLGIPGWFWSLSLKVIDKTLNREELKEDRVQYDMFESVALGFRLVFWPAIVMLPLAPLFAAIVLSMTGMAVLRGDVGMLGAGAVGVIVAYFALPYLFFPQALVHMSVRHRFKAWILWDQLVCFFKNAPATIYWWVVAVIVFLPAIVLLVLAGLNLVSLFEWTYAKLDEIAAWMFAFIIDVNTPEDRGLFFMVLFSLFIPVAMGVVMAPFAFLISFPAVFMMKATGLYGFYRREHLDLVTQVSENQYAGFWVRFLCHAIDLTILNLFHTLMFTIPLILVLTEFPLGRYFGGAAIPCVNLGLVAIAGMRNKRASGFSLGMGVLAGVTFIYGESIAFFQLVYAALNYLLPILNAWMYFAVNEASTARSTIGKEAFGLIVQTVDKRKELTLGQATLRHVGRCLSYMLAGLPFVVAAFHPKKQALEDLIAGSEVCFRGDK